MPAPSQRPTALNLRFAGGSGLPTARLFVGGQASLSDRAFMHEHNVGLVIEAAGGDHTFERPRRADGITFA